MNDQHHEPVLLEETIKFLDPKKNENFVDGTVGDGGHASEILKLTEPAGKLIGFDRDDRALRRAQHNLSTFGERIKLINSNYENLDQYVPANFKASGILLDLGFSLIQIKDPKRGFSFRENGPLDMRYDMKQKDDAAHIVNFYNEEDLYQVIWQYGEDRFARRIAKAIVQERKKSPIATTLELVNVISKAIPKKFQRSKLHFATRTFQALRIETNEELDGLEETLPKAINVLKKNGRLAVISFHSLEDRIVKRFFKQMDREGAIKILTKKPIKPSEEEVGRNPRARSAKLRVCEKI
jgi:16S rRNA (cytosine1402-N4)-methyltransferase